MNQNRPKSEKIGKIVLDVYENGQTFCTMEGEVPTNAMQMARVSLKMGFARHLQELGAKERKRVAEEKRGALIDIAEQQRKQGEIDAEKMKLVAIEKEKLSKLKADLELQMGITPETLSLEERTSRGAEIKRLKSEIEEQTKVVEGAKEDGKETE